MLQYKVHLSKDNRVLSDDYKQRYASDYVSVSTTMSARILEGPKFRFPYDEGTLGQFFFKYAEKYNERICQIDATTDKSETYSSVKLRSIRVAIEMGKRGITSKDVITLCCANTLDNTIPMLAAFYLGAKVSNLDKTLSVGHTKHLLDLVTPSIIFVEEEAVGLIEESLVGADFKPEIVVFGTSEKYSTFSDFLKVDKCETSFKPLETDPDDDAVFMFSSGTTGLPKAITHSSRTFLYMALQFYQTGVHERLLHFTQFYWLTAMMCWMSSFKAGSYRVFARDASGEDTFKIIEKYKIVYIFAAPVLTYKLETVQNPEKYDTSSLRLIACGGAPLAKSQIEKMNKIFKSARIGVGFGMSEIGTVAVFDTQLHQGLAGTKVGSCGPPAAGIILKIVDIGSGTLLGPYQKGEIRLKAPSMMKGYYRGDSSQAFDDEGFLKSGDIGYYDEDDCVYLVERIKEIFKYQSYQIAPSSIEAVLLQHPSIKEVAVFGVPAGGDGDIPAAWVVLNEGESTTEEEIDEFLKGKVADRERLRGGVTFVGDLPKTPTGKIARMIVKDRVINAK